ncbi:MAG: toprim domain-containing protein [Bacilli bacterium]|nr:toprim domain-containing protein [Bacilli bacterium]
MKNKINGIIVVEGENDASYVSSLIDAEIVYVNGLALDNINYLKLASKYKKIYLMTDPDNEGKNIRKKIKKMIENVVDIEIDIDKCVKGSKNGVKECLKNEILYVLSPYFVDNVTCIEDKIIKIYDKKFRDFVCNNIGMEFCNNKTFNERIKTLKISESEMKKMNKEFEDGN